ncbi:MAG: hypothetical protein ACRDZ5_02195 [Acidimicrobiales bacterium]
MGKDQVGKDQMGFLSARLRLGSVAFVVVAATFVTAFATTASATSASAPAEVQVTNHATRAQTKLFTCTAGTVTEPRTFVITCADANAQLTSAHWDSWNRSRALGITRFGLNLCKPNCAASRMSYFPGSRVVLSGIELTSRGWLFSSLVVHYQLHHQKEVFRFSWATAPPFETRFLSCSGRAVIEPRSLVISCADHNSELTKIHWARWSTAGAVATALLGLNLCKPNCAASKMSYFPDSRVLVSAPELTSHGRLFSRLTVRYRLHGRQSVLKISWL